MSEERVPYNAGGDKANYNEIALVLNKYLQNELLMDVQYPVELTGEYFNYTDAKKAEWYSFTYHVLFGRLGEYVAASLGRQLNKKELLFISGRLEAFIKTQFPG